MTARVLKESTLNFQVWQPISAGKVTLQELETHYTLEDLHDLLEIIEIEAALQEEQDEKDKQNNR